MNTYTEEFKEYLKSKNRSENTISSYMHDINIFLDYCRGKKATDISNITPSIVSGYILHIKANSTSTATASRRLSAIKLYFTFACKKIIAKITLLKM